MLQKRLYWISTALLALLYAAGGVFYLVDTMGVQAIWGTLGFPGYLVPILAVAKLAAAAVILWRPTVALTELAYAGMFFHLLLAVSAHVHAGDGGFAPALIALLLLVLSHATQNAGRSNASPFGRWPLQA